MQTPDGAWRVEVVRRGRTRWYRIVNEARDVTVEWLSIAGVQHIVERTGADLVPAGPVVHRDDTTGAA